MSQLQLSNTLRERLGQSLENKLSASWGNNLKGLIGTITEDKNAFRNLLKSATYNNIVLTQKGFYILLDKFGIEPNSALFDLYVDYFVYRKTGGKKNISNILDIYTTESDNILPGQLYNGMMMPEGVVKSRKRANDPWAVLNNTPYVNLSDWTAEFFELQGVNPAKIKEVLKTVRLFNKK